jgi:predicted phosphodiesterase
MTRTPITEHCADLTMDDAVTRAGTAKPTVGPSIDTDADYLRSDGHYILDILSNSKAIFNVVAPRRWGKTSFLMRVQRHAEATGRRVVLAAFNESVSAVVEDLAKFFGVEASVDAIGAAVRALPPNDPERPIILLDEGAGQIEARDGWGHAMRSLLTQLAAAAARGGRITLCHAEIPQFFDRCGYQGDELDRPTELVDQDPILLKPVDEGVRQAFLRPVVEAGHGELASEVGSIPGEIQSLRLELTRLVQSIDTEKLRSRFETTWTNALRTVVQNLDRDQRAVLWRACQHNLLLRKDLTPHGRVVQQCLEDWGLLKTEPGQKILPSSTATGELLKGLIEAPCDEDLKSVFKENPEEPPISKHSLLTPTFDNGFIIHQIADLHFGKFGLQAGGKWLPEYYLDYLARLSTYDRPHVIIVCGDLTSFGLHKEVNEAARFVKKLKGSSESNSSSLLQPLFTGSVPNSEKQIVVVPGNHDMAWDENREDNELAIKPFMDFLELTEVVSPFSPCPAIHFEPASITILACNSAHLGGVNVPPDYLSMPSELKTEHGDAFEQVLRDVRRLVEAHAATHMHTSDGEARKKALLNIIRFTWGYVDKKFLEMVEEKISAAEKVPEIPTPDGVELFKPEPNIRIGALHHNVSVFGDGSLFADLINSGKVVKSFVDNDINLLLHGHQHQFNLTGETMYSTLEQGSGRNGTEAKNYDELKIRKTLHCIGADSLGAPLRGGNPSFNRIVVYPDSIHQKTRKVEISNIELRPEYNSGELLRPREVSKAELHVYAREFE